MKRIALAVLAAGYLAVATTGVGRATSEEPVSQPLEETLPLAPGGEVSLGVLRGDVLIATWDQQEVRIKAVKLAGSQDDLDSMEVAIDADPDRVAIETKYPSGRSRGRKKGKKMRPRVNYELTVPRQAHLGSVEMHKGDLEIVGAEGGVVARGTNGDMTFRSLRGDVRVSSGAGRVDYFCDGIDTNDRVELTSGLGPVVLHLAGTCGARVHATMSGGMIRNETRLLGANQFNAGIDELAGGGSEFRARYGKGIGEIRITTSTGPIVIVDW